MSYLFNTGIGPSENASAITNCKCDHCPDSPITNCNSYYNTGLGPQDTLWSDVNTGSSCLTRFTNSQLNQLTQLNSRSNSHMSRSNNVYKPAVRQYSGVL